MLIIPAIDILHSKCVRLRQGRYSEATVFSDDPVAVAREWARQGAKFLHVVDLEGARTGEPKILAILKRIVQVGLPVEVGGGMRLMANIDDAIAAGATRISIGTRAATDTNFAHKAINTFHERIIIDIAAKDGMAAIQGWQKVTKQRAIDLAKEMEQLGAERILFTDVARDGMLQGPNYASLTEMVAAVGIPVIASGGITRIKDVARLKYTGVEACIIGRALYTGTIKLPEAIEAGRE